MKRRIPEPEPIPTPRADCKHCRNAVRLERSAEAVPETAAAARSRAAFERTLCDHDEELRNSNENAEFRDLTRGGPQSSNGRRSPRAIPAPPGCGWWS